MKILIVILGLLILASGCSLTGDAVSSELQTKTYRYDESSTTQTQYKKAIAMVDASSDLSKNQKSRVKDLIGQYAIKSKELKIKESQYRAVLIDEMLDGPKNKKQVSLAKNSIKDINTEGSNNLREFVEEFKSIAGDTAMNHHALMLQTLDVY